MNADFPNFLHCRLIDKHGRGQSISTPDIETWKPDQGMLWVHIDIGDAASRRWLLERSGVDEAVVDMLLAEDVRPRSVVTDTGLFVVLRGVNTNPGEDPEDMVAIRIWIEDGRIISVRRRALLSVQDILAALDAGRGPATAGQFLAQLMERMADRIGEFVDSIEKRLEIAEDDSATTPTRDFRKRLSGLRRQIASVRRFLAPQRDALDRLYRQAGHWLSRDDAEQVREEADRITRNLEDLDLARERAVVMQEEMLGQIAQEQNARMYLLSIVAAVFLPLTFVTGLFGMNVGGLPWLENNSGFVFTLLIMGIGAVALGIYFRWRRWI